MSLPSPLVNGNYPLDGERPDGVNGGTLVIGASGTGTATIKLQYLSSEPALEDITNGGITVGMTAEVAVGSLDVYLDVASVLGDVYVTVGAKI